MLPKTEKSAEEFAESAHLPADLIKKAVEDTMWKFGVMFADAKDTGQERIRYLVEMLGSGSSLERAAAALSLPWYVDGGSVDPLKRAATDPDEVVRKAATWALSALQTTLKYRGQLGL
jgi:HEAT repeat protein